MAKQLQQTNQKLYETDYNLWVLDTVKKLKERDFAALDLEELIDEILDLSRRSKKKVKSLLRNLFEHLLKLSYWESEVERNQFHWQGEIRNFRKQIRDELEDSPSLRNYLQGVFEECYEDAKEIVSDRSQLPLDAFPEKAIASLEQVLDENWLPE
ncbi:DUF29 domain-containing protein [Spirulina sp. CS-785/01]|uniref:DUF29 domain-containing protein n=1 Tax=Spirulina sp. CS-785/01 TaxID=3021716 RepID=UPI00232C4D6C|nr:DUF29 domain-containing protein [Spirulina sp. CS-785/01]MDB9312945.1 DUF29 domain-containing protein [Spirulina sp. CS-785/01]